jgi:hypothetical protein
MSNQHLSPRRPPALLRKITRSVSATALAVGRGKSDYDDPIDRASPPKMAYTVAEAAFASGLSRSSLYVSIRSGALITRKCGRRTLVLHDDLVNFLSTLPRISIGWKIGTPDRKDLQKPLRNRNELENGTHRRRQHLPAGIA